MGKTTDAIRETVAPKNGEGKLDLKKLLKRWASFMAVLGVLGTIWTGFSYVKDKLDAIEASTADIIYVKNQNAALAQRIEKLEDTLVAAINERTLATQGELSSQREVDVELRESIKALLTEVRIRHGALGSGGGGGRGSGGRATALREATVEADRAQVRAENALPQADPLSGIAELH